MKNVAIVQFPGSNCERETALAVKRAGMIPIELLWNEPIAKLKDMDAFIIVGGFSYEDRSRAGIIAALDPLMNEIKIQSELGKPVLGICNGAQILVETGLVPGLDKYQPGMVLCENKRIVDGKILGTGFYNSWIHMRICDNARPNAFTRHLTKDSILNVPIAHAEGRFMMSEQLLQELSQEGMTVFQYCDEDGRISDNFPVNPNGSMKNIAAVINKAGNVMAMMPHPERTPAGDAIFRSMLDYIREAKSYQKEKLSYSPVKAAIKPYQENSSSTSLIVQLIITDNCAVTVQNTLKQQGLPVQVKRLVHWEIDTNDAELLKQIKQTGVLFNDRKEFLVNSRISERSEARTGMMRAFLVRPKEDLLGQQKLQMLYDHFGLTDIRSIRHSILWIFESETHSISDFEEAILNTHIIANPCSHEVYYYV
ncbi:MAG: phosphoribosylformylglycinamidine synthase I [Legionella sp.]